MRVLEKHDFFFCFMKLKHFRCLVSMYQNSDKTLRDACMSILTPWDHFICLSVQLCLTHFNTLACIHKWCMCSLNTVVLTGSILVFVLCSTGLQYGTHTEEMGSFELSEPLDHTGDIHFLYNDLKSAIGQQERTNLCTSL